MRTELVEHGSSTDVTVVVRVAVVQTSHVAVRVTHVAAVVVWTIVREVALLTLGVVLIAAGWVGRTLAEPLTEAGLAALQASRLGGG